MMTRIKKFTVLGLICAGMIIFPQVHVFAEEIKIIEPMDGAIVYEGDRILINVDVPSSIKLTSLLIVTRGGTKKFTEPPYRWDTIIPEEMGTLGIVALGKTTSGQLLSSKTSLTVKSHATLQKLEELNHFDKYYLKHPGDRMQLSVKGIYSDGKTRSLDKPDVGMSFASSNNSVAVVDKEGMITVTGYGNCIVTASNSGKTLAVQVIVKPPK